MKYRAVGDTAEEQVALDSGALPRAEIDTLMPLVQVRAIMAGVRLGLFEALAACELEAVEVAHDRGLDAECVDLILRVLVCAGYLTRVGARYGLTALARDTMLRDAPRSLCAATEMKFGMWRALDRLEEVARTGKGINLHSWDDPDWWRAYVRGMSELIRFEGPVCAERVPLGSGARRMLDLGGSHGLLGALICRRYPGLTSQVIDLPPVIEHARTLATELGIDDVVSYRPGDILSAPFDEDVDLVLLASVAHHLSADQNRAVSEKSFKALAPGGTFAIWEAELPGPSADADIYGEGYALIFRVTSTSRVFTGEEYASWLRSAGFHRVAIERPPELPGAILVTGQRPNV